jgi:ketosteroid isomerase-like protein
MTRFLLLSIAVAASVVAADPTEAVREAAHGWRQGAIKQDPAALQRFLSDELVYTHGGGKTQSKTEYIADVTKGAPHYESFNESSTRIRVFGNVATLTGLVEVKPGKGEPYQVRTFEVYAQKNGNWQLVQKESARLSR